MGIFIIERGELDDAFIAHCVRNWKILFLTGDEKDAAFFRPPKRLLSRLIDEINSARFFLSHPCPLGEIICGIKLHTDDQEQQQ